MDYYYNEFNKLQQELHEVMHDYPLFKEDIDKVEKEVKIINDLLDKNDEYYLKSANSKVKDLINFIKDTNLSIKKEYERFDKLAGIWDKIRISNTTEEKLNDINNKVKKANELIKSHSLPLLKEANIIMEELIKENE